MVTKQQINLWIEKLNELSQNLQVGGGAFISASYSKENEELHATAIACKNLLTLYYNYEGLNVSQLRRFQTLLEEIRAKAFQYELAKKTDKKYPYSLHGDARNGILAASGDKYTRLKAASDLNDLARKTLLSLEEEISASKEQPEIKLSSEFQKVEETLGNPNADATEISKNIQTFMKKENKKAEFMAFYRCAVNAKQKYSHDMEHSFRNRNTDTIGNVRKEFLEIKHLHRLELMNYNNSNAFLTSYKKHRYKISQVVDIYEWAMKCKKGTEKEKRLYHLLRVSMGLTVKQFDDLGKKVSTLEMIGRHMDARMEMCTNPEFTKMSVHIVKDIAHMNQEQLLSTHKMMTDNIHNPQMPKEYKPSPDRLKYLEKAYYLKQLEEIGIVQKKDPNHRAEVSLIDRQVEKGNLTRRFKFLNAQARYSRKAVKGDVYISSSDIPVITKAKLGKISFKYHSNNQLFRAGVHTGVLGVKAGGSVGYSFSLKHPLDANIKMMGLAEAYAARGVAKTSFGGKNVSVYSKASGHIGYANAEGTVAVGHVYKTDEKGNVEIDGFGVNVQGSIGASVFHGKIKGGFSLFGLLISVEVKGQALGAGIEGECTVLPNCGLKLGVGGALGLGGGVYISMNWKALTQKYSAWKKRKAIAKATLKLKKEEEKLRTAKARKSLKNDATQNTRKRSATVQNAKLPKKGNLPTIHKKTTKNRRTSCQIQKTALKK